MTKPRLAKVRALFYVLQRVTKKRLRHFDTVSNRPVGFLECHRWLYFFIWNLSLLRMIHLVLKAKFSFDGIILTPTEVLHFVSF